MGLEKQFRMGRARKMFVYLPVYLQIKKPGRQPADGREPDYQMCVIKEMPYTRVEVGDSFITTKRDSAKEILSGEGDLKVEQVKHSIVDGSCIVILQKKVFENQSEMKSFLLNKKYIR